MAYKYLQREHLSFLIDLLYARGYDVLGPRLRDDAIVYDELHQISELPQGVMVEQSPGAYKIKQTTSPRFFSWSNGPSALKPLLFKPRQPLWEVQQAAEETDTGLIFKDIDINDKPIAVLGVRPCDIAALELSDRHFVHADYVDSFYQSARTALFTVAVNCDSCADTCFCASTGDGPALDAGADITMDELDEGFVLRAGSETGEALLLQLPVCDVSKKQMACVEAQRRVAKNAQKRFLINENMHANLFSQLDSDYWHRIAERCLSCGNCTAVCPTCFCHRELDQPDLDGESSVHFREWSSCFNHDHSVMHGHALRDSNELRYRQWMLHKLGSWIYQYGRSGCVGCGRCISWCPAGIDFPAEANAVSGEFGLWT